MKSLQYENLHIQLPFNILQIERITLEEKVNDHAVCSMECMIEEGKAEEYIRQSTNEKEIRISDSDTIVFIGKCIEFNIIYRNHLAMLKLQAVSYTYDMDRKRRKRAYTNTNIKYKDLIHSIIEPYGEKCFSYMVEENERIGQLLVQYRETEWEFLKRIASHFGTVLVVCPNASKARFYFGLPKAEHKITFHSVTEMTADFKELREVKCLCEDRISQNNFIKWNVESKEYVPLGTRTTYKGKAVIVTQIHIEYSKGEVIYEYELHREEGIQARYIGNTMIKGVSMEATVKKCSGNRMQVHFCVNDSYSESENTLWIPYARETGNFYTMPVLESKVHIYFPTENEKEAYVTNCIYCPKEEAAYFSKMQNPQNKSLTTSQGQELFMNEEMVMVSADKENHVQVMLRKGGGVTITGSEITIESDGAIQLGNAQPFDAKTNPYKVKQISISAKKRVTLNGCTGQTIELNDESHLYGMVKLNE